jgi:hypothetical protein
MKSSDDLTMIRSEALRFGLTDRTSQSYGVPWVLLPANSFGSQTGVRGITLRNLKIGSIRLENERFQELLTRVVNLNWETPDWPDAFCAVYPRYAYFHCNTYYPLASDEMTPAEYDEYQKRLREFIG